MLNYPRDPAARQAERTRRFDDHMLRAAAQARRIGLSIKCGEYGHHSDVEGGCQNTGVGCLCECHDAAPVALADGNAHA